MARPLKPKSKKVGRKSGQASSRLTTKRAGTKTATRRVATKKRAARAASGAERRRAERAPVMVLEVRGKSYDKLFVGYAENLSQTGLFLSAANPPPVGTTFPVEFVLPDNRTFVQCTCRVVWQHRYQTTGRPSVGVGIEFVDLDGLKRSLIDQWVNRKTPTLRPTARRRVAKVSR